MTGPSDPGRGKNPVGKASETCSDQRTLPKWLRDSKVFVLLLGFNQNRKEIRFTKRGVKRRTAG